MPSIPMWSPVLSNHLYQKVTFSCPHIKTFIFIEHALKGQINVKEIEGAINNGQSRETGNIGHTRHQ